MSVSARRGEPAILRDGGGRSSAGGVLVGAREVVTCAHVVSEALGEADDALGAQVTLDFPLVAPGVRVAARVVLWEPPWADGTGDIAGLVLADAPPARVRRRSASAGSGLLGRGMWPQLNPSSRQEPLERGSLGACFIGSRPRVARSGLAVPVPLGTDPPVYGLAGSALMRGRRRGSPGSWSGALKADRAGRRTRGA